MDPLPKTLGRRLGITARGAGRHDTSEHATRLDGVLEPAAGSASGGTLSGVELDGLPTRRTLPRRAPQRLTRPGWPERSRPWIEQLRMPLAVYAATRLVYLVIAIFDGIGHGWSLQAEVTNWDGVWYTTLTNFGYPHVASHLQTTLGFLPLYPMAMWLVSHVCLCSAATAGLMISTVGGFVATVLVQQLALRWWGEEASRRVVLFFCLFPGSIVFSMDYSEGLLLPLAAGCLLALEHRRWLLAGLLAGLATAVGPVALAIVPACAIAAWQELRRRGWLDREARRSLLAPLLAPLGLLAFGAFLWAWTGTPLASYNAQRYGWGEKSTLMAIPHDVGHAVHQLFSWQSFHHPGINLNYDSGVLGAIFLLAALWLIFRTRPRIPAAAIAWTVWIAVLTLTSANTPPNPRMLICAFPAVMVVAYRLRGKAYSRLIVASSVFLVVMSTLTYVGTPLRP